MHTCRGQIGANIKKYNKSVLFTFSLHFLIFDGRQSMALGQLCPAVLLTYNHGELSS